MHGLGADVQQLEALLSASVPASVQLLLCPPATLVARFADAAKGGQVAIGGQDCHAEKSGAHTGDVSAEMLADAGASHVIVGHSERRADHGETNEIVRAKAEAVLRAGLMPIICVGETLAQRDAGETLTVIADQLRGSVPAGGAEVIIAYEPVWAIGTGHTPTAQQVGEVHAAIAAAMPAGTRILYGGSVKPDNAAELLAIAHVDGALVGGASLKAADFLGIANTQS